MNYTELAERLCGMPRWSDDASVSTAFLPNGATLMVTDQHGAHTAQVEDEEGSVAFVGDFESTEDARLAAYEFEVARFAVAMTQRSAS